LRRGLVEVYLVQHGEARPESEDPERPLAYAGRAQVEAAAQHLAACGITVSRILHSGKLRARQTAGIFAQYLDPAVDVMKQDGLGPNDDPEIAMQVLTRSREPVMIVGHLPHLSRLASLLVLGDADRSMVSFQMGGVVCLGSGDGGWMVRWALVPDLVLM
jgi:phosphohistidine phosphatase